MKQIIRRVAALIVGLGLGAGALAGLEVVTHISDLNASWPLGSDLASTSDDHLRNIKSALKTDFPNINAAVTATPAQLNQLTTNTFTSAVTGNSFIPSSSTVPPNGLYLPAANTLGFASNTTKWGSVNSTGNWVLVTPGSGTSLIIPGVQGTNTQFTGPNTGAGWNLLFTDSTNSVNRGFIGIGTNTVGGAALTDFAISPGASGSVVIGTASGGAIGTRFGPNGNVTINAPSSGTGLQVAGAGGSNTYGMEVDGSTAANSRGLIVKGGVITTTDQALTVNDAASTVNLFAVLNTPAIQARGPVAAALVDMTPDTGTFTATATGLTTSPTGTATWARIGKLVTINIPAITGTSNATTFTLTGLPSAIQPATITSTLCMGSPATNNGVLQGNCQGNVQFTAGSGTITLLWNFGAWTNSGQKSINSFTVSYLLN